MRKLVDRNHVRDSVASNCQLLKEALIKAWAELPSVPRAALRHAQDLLRRPACLPPSAWLLSGATHGLAKPRALKERLKTAKLPKAQMQLKETFHKLLLLHQIFSAGVLSYNI